MTMGYHDVDAADDDDKMPNNIELPGGLRAPYCRQVSICADTIVTEQKI